MQSAFRSFAKEIDHRDEIRESLVKLSRDITRSSKKLLFSLHRGDPFDQIDSQLVQVRSLLHRIGSTEDHARHSRSYSPGVQEYVEAEVFAKYLREHSLVRIHEINDALDGFTVSHEDYLLGLLDATGEMMRKAIELASSANIAAVLEIRDFLQMVHIELSMIPMHYERDYEQKMSTLVSSIHKVEQACFRRMIRKKEFPEEEIMPRQHFFMQDDAFSEQRMKRDREDESYDD